MKIKNNYSKANGFIVIANQMKNQVKDLKINLPYFAFNGILNCVLIKTTDTVLHFGKTSRAVT